MDIEDILRQKAAAKEAERLRQQQEQEAATAEAERRQKQEAEEARLGGLRQSIADIDAKTGQMQLLLSRLGQVHDQARTSAGEAKKERQELTKATAEIDKLFANVEFRALLAEEGIKSSDDLLQAEEYAEQEQVQSVKGLEQSHIEKRRAARERIGARRQAKVEAHKTITTERPDVPQTLTYNHIATALEKLVQELGVERKNLYYQTPEGQEEKRQEAENRVVGRHERRGASHSLLDNLDRNDLVDPEDIKDAEEYGGTYVKNALIKVWSGRIDGEIQRKKEQAGLHILSQDIQALQDSEKRFPEVQRAVRAAEDKRLELAQHLIKICTDNPDNLKRLNNYRGVGSRPAEAAIHHYLEHLDYLDQYENNFQWARGFIAQYNPDVRKRGDLFDQSRRSGRGDYYETNAINPDRFIDIARKAVEFYEKQIQENQERLVLPNEKKRAPEARAVQKTDDWRRRETYVYAHKKTEEYLKHKSLPDAAAEVGKSVAALDVLGGQAKEKVKKKLEKDWTERELSVYLRDHREAYDIVQQKEKIDQLKPRAKVGEEILAVERIKLGVRTQERVSVEKSRYTRGEYYVSVPDLNTEQEADQKKLEQLNQELTSLVEQITVKTNEDRGFWGRKEKRIAEELKTLQEQKRAKNQEMAGLGLQIDQRNQRINAMNELSKVINTAELGSNYADREMTIGELMDDLAVRLREIKQGQLTPEQQQIYDVYVGLHEKAEAVKKVTIP